MRVPFIKANACGNDFLIIDSAYAPDDPEVFTRRICDRHCGVGADGVEWLYPAAGVSIEARLINADGSPAEISGNGTRCVAAYLCAQQESARESDNTTPPLETFLIRTGAGDKECRLTSRNGASYEFETAMGVPEVRSELALRTSFGLVRGIPVSMGNPHFVVFVSDFPGDWPARAATLQRDSSFPHGVNIEFVRALDRQHLEVRFFERGVGETMSSGTGTSAAAAAAIATARAETPLHVNALGGAQLVRWDPPAQLYLRGSAELICQGDFFA
jgi:diaminopimelate epimerase